MRQTINFALLIALLTALASSQLLASAIYRPFIMADPVNARSVETAATEVQAKLNQAGLEIVGQYSPFPGAIIIGVTSAELKKDQ